MDSLFSPPPLPPSLPQEPPPIPPAMTARSPARRSRYIAAHWRGELSLAQSYWVNCLLVSVAMRIINIALTGGLSSTHVSLTAALVVIVAFVLLSVVVTVWQVVGTLRSAAFSGSRWAILVNILMVLSLLGLLSTLIVNVRTIEAIARGAAEQRRFGQYTIGIDAGGTAIITNGTIGVGYAQAVIDAFEQHPQIHLLHLNSRGGDVDNGMELHDYLAAHPAITAQVDSLCASACTLAFIGANQRLVAPRAVMGFHQMHSLVATTYSRGYVETKQEAFKTFLAQRGASADFIRLAFAKQGDDVYVPDIDELFANHVITGVRLGDRIATADDWRREQFLEAYRERGDQMPGMAAVLDLIRRNQPDLFRRWTDQNLVIKQRPTHEERVAGYGTALWSLLHSARSRAMSDASAEDVREFAMTYRQMLELLRAGQSAEACGHYLLGQDITLGTQAEAFYRINDEGYRALLSGRDLIQPGPADWLGGAHVLAQTRAAVVAAAGPATSNPRMPAAVCRGRIELLDRLLALPVASGSMALRRYFGADEQPMRVSAR